MITDFVRGEIVMCTESLNLGEYSVVKGMIYVVERYNSITNVVTLSGLRMGYTSYRFKSVLKP